MIRTGFYILAFLALWGCKPAGPEITDVDARPGAPSRKIEPGNHALGLGGLKLVNRSVIWRDGRLYVPKQARQGRPLPLLVWLHGGGGNADSFQYAFAIAEQAGVVILALDSRHNTWDGIDSPFGPDVLFIGDALRYTFDRVAIDPARIALGGLSDGGAYALSLGLTNGDLFTHLVAVAPGYTRPPAPLKGKPKIFVGHGRRDNVYGVSGSRDYIVPALKRDGYEVTYYEFDGPHWVPEPVVRRILAWLKG